MGYSFIMLFFLHGRSQKRLEQGIERILKKKKNQNDNRTTLVLRPGNSAFVVYPQRQHPSDKKKKKKKVCGILRVLKSLLVFL